MDLTHTRYNRAFALLVFGITLAVYVMTVAPTVPFWDCGEYIGAAHSLGIPHPPGNPLYVLLGRATSILLGFFNDVGYRINLISSISGAFTAMMLYLLIVRVTTLWMGKPDTTWKKITTYTGGVVGALFAGFGSTYWFSCVEAEVIMPSMLIVVIGTWLALKWADSKSPTRDRYLLLIAYLVFLGIGIHMFTMMTMAPVGLFILLVDKEKRTDWRLWVVGFLLMSVMFAISWFFWIGPILIAFTFVMSLFEGANQRKWRFVFWLSFVALLGYSVHLFIPIRSALEPIINENHPDDWQALRAFLERKQYGSENMITRMFWRRGSLLKQFGVDSNMGFGGFHLTQFFHFGGGPEVDRTASVFENWGALGGLSRLIIYLVPTFFMFFGWFYLFKRNRNVAILMITMVILGTIGLVFYMNFADGTRLERRDFDYWQSMVQRAMQQGMSRQQAEAQIQMPPPVHREVRVRDYFFTPGFMFLGVWMGIAASCLLHFLFTNKDRFFRTTLAPIIAVLLAVSPAIPLTQNFSSASRAGDYVPYDYAYNLLMSCDKDGILFTNGDNDTFPLWALQEAYGIRKDVRIVNLSLLNTNWYIKQLKDLEPKVPINFSDEQIDGLTHEANRFEQPVDYTMSRANITVRLPSREEKNALRVQDKMVLHIVDANAWRKPIYFAVTVSNDGKMGLDPYLQMEGLVYRLNPEQVPASERIDIDKTVFLLDKVYNFRGLGDGDANMNETSYKLLTNYAAGYIQVAMALRQPLSDLKQRIEALEQGAGETNQEASAELAATRKEYQEKLDLAIGKMDQCISLMPYEWRWRMLRQEMLMAHGLYDQAENRAREALEIEPNNPEYLKSLGQALSAMGQTDEANNVWRKLVNVDSNPWDAHLLLARSLEEKGEYDSAIDVMKKFQESHPGDRRASQMISLLQKSKAEDSVPTVAPSDS